MRFQTSYLFIILFFSITIISGCKENNSSSFIPIFDGKTYGGWEGSKDFFRIENGAIVAGALDRKIPQNQFLCTEKSYQDFELRLKVRFTSKVNNAGIQFRTERIPNHHEVIGYQADVGFVGDSPVWGSIYDESRRKKFLKEAEHEKVLEALQVDGWNDYRILCQGSKIKFWINGTLLMDYVEEDPNISQSGVICVQIHSGAPAEAWYKDIQIQEL